MIKKINLKKNKDKKAQVWAIDLSIAFVLFVGVILLFYRYSISFAPEDPIVNKIIQEGNYASNALLGTGYPENWSDISDTPEGNRLEKTYSIGLLNSDGMLNLTKAAAFKTMIGSGGSAEYNLSRRKLNTEYEYFIEFSDGNANPFIGALWEGEIGWNCLAMNPKPKQIVKIQRLVAYKDTDDNTIKPVKLILYLWTNQAA